MDLEIMIHCYGGLGVEVRAKESESKDVKMTPSEGKLCKNANL